MKIGDHEAVEVGEVVVYPLLPCLIVSDKASRQPLHRIEEARRANLGVQRGVAHRSALCTSVTVIGLYILSRT
eukprot:scaffold28598_cov126-Isochrysis_galbana.AAC.2